MPNPLPQDASRLDAALNKAIRLRRCAANYRLSATKSFNSKPLLIAAREADAQADAIVAAMKEGEGHG